MKIMINYFFSKIFLKYHMISLNTISNSLVEKLEHVLLVFQYTKYTYIF